MKNNEYAIELATISLTIMQVILRRRLGDKAVVAHLVLTLCHVCNPTSWILFRVESKASTISKPTYNEVATSP